MSNRSTMWRVCAAFGIVFATLYFLGMLVFTPSDQPTVHELTSNLDEITLGALLALGAAPALTFFMVALRRRLSGDTASNYLSLAPVLGGALLLAGIAVNSTVLLAMTDAAEVHQAAAVSAFGFLNRSDFLPIVSGLGVLGLGTGVAGLHHHRLPVWLSVISLLFGALALAGPVGELAFIITPGWFLLVSLFLVLRPDPAPEPTASAQRVVTSASSAQSPVV